MMVRYRKKPVVIEAIRNTGAWRHIMVWLNSLNDGPMGIPLDYKPTILRNKDGSLVIRTLEGDMRAEVGDYVICGVRGEFYPCKPDIFKATYEPAED